MTVLQRKLCLMVLHGAYIFEPPVGTPYLWKRGETAIVVNTTSFRSMIQRGYIEPMGGFYPVGKYALTRKAIGLIS